MRHVSTALFLFVGLALFLGLIWAGCSAFLKNNGAYERGVATAVADPVLAEALGAPVEESWFINGSIEGDGMQSQGVWLVRLKGSERGGTLRIAGVKRGGDWRTVAMSLEVDDVLYTYVAGKGFVEEDAGVIVGPPDILG